MSYTNQILSRWIKQNKIKCPSCNRAMTLYKIKNYDDPHGIWYEDFPFPQQVTFKCSSCKQRNSINKLLSRYPL